MTSKVAKFALGLAGALALAALGGCDNKQAAAPVRPAGDFPDCRSADLAIRRVAADEAAGAVTYGFTNHGQTCVLKGHAQIALTGRDQKPLALSQTDFSPPAEVQRRPLKVVLRPDRQADFQVFFPKGKACRPFVKLTATPPGSDWGLDVAESGSLCGDAVTVSSFWYDASKVL